MGGYSNPHLADCKPIHLLTELAEAMKPLFNLTLIAGLGADPGS